MNSRRQLMCWKDSRKNDKIHVLQREREREREREIAERQ
jgi:hypothetical protein